MPPVNVPFIPPANPYLLPRQPFETLIARLGYRTAWMKAHTCPCTFAGGGPQGRLPSPGQAQPDCQQCHGFGVYWDAPSTPFRAGISFMHMAPTPDEPGVVMDDRFGLAHMAEPSLTIPYVNPFLAPDDPGQPTQAWENAGTEDKFVMIDMQTRFNAVLQVSGIVSLPYQQNLIVAASGAVTTYDPVATTVTAVSGYSVSGATVLLPPGYAPGTNYIVEFFAAPVYVAFRKAGGDPHIRPIAGGQINEPRRFRLQALDFWLRQNAPGAQTYAAPLSNY